jgi:hypothetical protein
MIKTGLYRIEQLSDLRNARGLFGGLRRISITLYDRTASIPDGEEWAERILFLHSEGRGAYKRTYSGRFNEFDTAVVRHITQAFRDQRTPAIHDAGVSDARTACDFFHKAAEHFPSVSYYASDYEPALSVLQLRNIKVSMNRKGEILEVVSPPFVFNLIKPENFLLYPVNYAFFLVARAVQVPRVLAAHQAGDIQPNTLLLFCAQAVQLSKSDSRFQLIEHDLLSPAPFSGPVDVVRVMNVLNSSYFSGQQLVQIVDRIFASLAIDGLLVVGSNDEADTEVRGAIYRKTDRGFAELMRSGGTHDAHRTIVEYSHSMMAPRDPGRERAKSGPQHP